jgi:hypothetical protein
MSVLARPGVIASTLAAAAVALHPGFDASRWLPARLAVLAALLLLAVLGLLARAAWTRGRTVDAALTAAGAAVLLVALGVDGLRGHHGTMVLAPGRVRSHFDETGPDGQPLGLRPLGFTVGAERVVDGGGVALALPGRRAPVPLAPGRAESFGGYRFAFSLLEIEPERSVEITVHREPAALAALVGALVLTLGVAGSLRSPLAPGGGGDAAIPPLAGGGVLVGLLLLADRGAVLAWTFGVPVPGGRMPLAGVGVAFGVSLIVALGGSLLLAAGRLAGDDLGRRTVARGSLWLAVLAAVAGLLLALVRSAAVPAGRTAAAGLPLAGIALGVALLAMSLLASQASPPPLVARAAGLAVPLAAFAAVALAIGAGVSGVLREGTYATPATAATAAAAIMGLAALQPTALPGTRRFAFLLVLLALTTG